MGRPCNYSPGDVVAKGKIKILEIIGQGPGKRAKALILCYWCNETKITSTAKLHKCISCGCMRHESSCWKSIGAKNRTWQLPSGEAAFNMVYYSYARNADQRGLEFKINKQEFRILCEKPCFYCGEQKNTVRKGLGKTSGNYSYTGVDRKDNSKGYLKDNVVPCCKLCNLMKRNLSDVEFFNRVELIYKNQFNVNNSDESKEASTS